MSEPTLLPPSIRDERSLVFERLVGRVVKLDLDTIRMSDPERAPSSALPILAKQWHIEGLEGWALAKTEADQRALLAQALRNHLTRGTPASVKAALLSLGWKAEIEENLPGFTYNGQVYFDGTRTFSDEVVWGAYRVHLAFPEGRAYDLLTASTMKAVLVAQTPARCVLESVRGRLEPEDTLPAFVETFSLSVSFGALEDPIPWDLTRPEETCVEIPHPVVVPDGYGEPYGWAYGGEA